MIGGFILSDFLKQSFQDALTSFNRYEGSGAYFTLFFIAMIIIFFYGRESKKAGSRDSYDTRIIFALYFPLLAFLMIINPLIAGPIMIGIDSFVYWRAFWIIPITIIIAIAMALFVMKVPRGSQRRLAVIACVAVIAVSGSLIYNAENYKKAENIYKLPEEAIAVCLMIRADTPDYASVAVPTALSPHIRQYDASIYMPYGRSTYGFHTNVARSLQSGSPDLESFKSYFDKYKVNYFVFYSETPHEVVYPDWCSPVGSAGDYHLVRVNGS